MRSVIIPAQITTVEDKIVGNLSMSQIMLLLIPVFWTGIVYVLFPASMEFTLYKILLIVLVFLGSLVAALRIKGILVVQWIAIIATYNLRPRYFVSNKNDLYLRDIEYPEFKSNAIFSRKKITKRVSSKSKAQRITYEDILKKRNIAVSVTFAKKGAFYVEKV